jgi:hypothetical protein
MAVQLHEENDGRVLAIQATGKLTKADYEQFLPEVNRLIDRHGTISILFEMHDFHGWDWSAAWEDVKFAAHHFYNIERLAVIGEKRWQKGMAVFCKPFTRAEIRYYEHAQAAEARAWLQAAGTYA